jgi:hypothetical protein
MNASLVALVLLATSALLAGCDGGASASNGASKEPPSASIPNDAGFDASGSPTDAATVDDAARPATITASLSASRLSGPAPLAVHFDATGSVSTQTMAPFRDVDYAWNFGDPGAGVWSQGARAGEASKNTDRGPIAGHVFERAGSYVVTLLADDGTSTDEETVTITVTDPNVTYAGNVYCYSNSPSTADDPAECAGHHLTVTSWEAVVANIDAVGESGDAYHRLKRGDTFTMNTDTSFLAADISAPNGGAVDAYGPAAAKPVIRIQGARQFVGAIALGGPRLAKQKPWTFMDLTIDGTDDTNHLMEGFMFTGGTQNVLLLRLTGRYLHLLANVAIGAIDSNNNSGDPPRTGHQPFWGLAIVDCEMVDVHPGTVGNSSTYPYGVYVEAEKFWLAGNSFDLNSDSGREVSHGIRVAYGWKFALVHNTVARSGNFQLSFKIHGLSSTAPNWTTTAAGVNGNSGGATKYGYVGDNQTWPAYGPVTMSVGAASDGDTPIITDVIVEGNWFKPSTGGLAQAGLAIEGANVTVRNNLFDVTGSNYHTGIYVGRDPGHLAPTTPAKNTFIYGNTFRNDDASTDFAAVVADAAGTGLIMKNNLAWSPKDASAVFGAGAVHSPGTPLVGDGAVVQANNSTDVQIRSTDPKFAGVPSVVGGWKLTSSSPYVGAGAVGTSVQTDFFGAKRPSPPSMGAAEP